MPRFRTACPACTNFSLVTWHHVGCPDNYGEYIDMNGYISCDCGARFHILDGRYNCGSSYHGDSYDPICSKFRLRTIIGMLTKVDGYDDNWIDKLEANVLSEWDKRNV